MGQAELTISLVMAGLFIVAILGFAINFSYDNDVAISITDDPSFVNLYTQTRGNISEFREDSNDTYQSIVKTNLDEGSDVAQNVGSFAITPGNIMNVLKSSLEVTYTKIFGGSGGFAIFLNTLVAMILFLFGLFLYKTLRGNPN